MVRKTKERDGERDGIYAEIDKRAAGEVEGEDIWRWSSAEYFVVAG